VFVFVCVRAHACAFARARVRVRVCVSVSLRACARARTRLYTCVTQCACVHSRHSATSSSRAGAPFPPTAGADSSLPWLRRAHWPRGSL
jgi:hypothetical protein